MIGKQDVRAAWDRYVRSPWDCQGRLAARYETLSAVYWTRFRVRYERRYGKSPYARIAA